MGDFGKKGECPECGREIGTVQGILRFHKDIEGDGKKCEGSGGEPKETALRMQEGSSERTDP